MNRTVVTHSQPNVAVVKSGQNARRAASGRLPTLKLAGERGADTCRLASGYLLSFLWVLLLGMVLPVSAWGQASPQGSNQQPTDQQSPQQSPDDQQDQQYRCQQALQGQPSESGDDGLALSNACANVPAADDQYPSQYQQQNPQQQYPQQQNIHSSSTHSSSTRSSSIRSRVNSRTSHSSLLRATNTKMFLPEARRRIHCNPGNRPRNNRSPSPVVLMEMSLPARKVRIRQR